jgi:hypothetical protein
LGTPPKKIPFEKNNFILFEGIIVFLSLPQGRFWALQGWRVPVSFGRFSNMDYYILDSAVMVSAMIL